MAISFGPTKTWKVVYVPIQPRDMISGVALVEAEDHHQAMHNFSQQYRGMYRTVERCEPL